MSRGQRPRDWRGHPVGRLRPLMIVGRRVRRSDPRKWSVLWLCVCARTLGGCGRLVVRAAETLTAGAVRSCGCWQRQRAATLWTFPRRVPRTFNACANCKANARGSLCGLCRQVGVPEESAA